MDEKQKAVMIAEAENIEAIRDFLSEWYSVEELYETLAKACTTFIYLKNRNLIDEDTMKVLENLVTHHEMMIDHIKPFSQNGKE